MGRPLRLTPAGGLHHVWGHESDGRPFFTTDDDRRRLVVLLRAAKDEHEVRVLSWCFMGNHFHLLVEDPLGRLSRAMHLVNGRFGRYRSDALGRPGVVFRSRFGSKLVQDDVYFATVVRYIARNPVSAGLCGRAEHWRWSSHRALAHGTLDPLLDHEHLLRRFEGRDTRERLRRCLELVAADRGPWEPPPPGLPARIVADGRPSLETLRQDLGIVEAARRAIAFGYLQRELVEAWDVPRNTLRGWLKA